MKAISIIVGTLACLFVLAAAVFFSQGQTTLGFIELAGLIGLWLWTLPIYVAVRRNHNQRFAIAILDLLLGWTFIGWVVAMVWACTSDVDHSSSDGLVITE